METTAPRCCGGGSSYAHVGKDLRVGIGAQTKPRGASAQGPAQGQQGPRSIELGPAHGRDPRAAKLSKLSRAAAVPTTPRALRTAEAADVVAARSPPRAPPPATPLKRGTLDALDAAWPAWGQEP